MVVRPIVNAIQVTQESTVNTRLLPATQIHANLVDVAWHIGELDSTIAIASQVVPDTIAKNQYMVSLIEFARMSCN